MLWNFNISSNNHQQFEQDEFEDDMMQLTNGMNSNSLKSSYENNNY
jgi:hypothetical protein